MSVLGWFVLRMSLELMMLLALVMFLVLGLLVLVLLRLLWLMHIVLLVGLFRSGVSSSVGVLRASVRSVWKDGSFAKPGPGVLTLMAQVDLYIDCSTAPLFDLRRSLKAVLDIIASIGRSGFLVFQRN